MKISTGFHAFNTWLVAHLLHPVMFMIFGIILRGTHGFDVSFIMIVTAFGIFFSIPSIFLLIVVLRFILRNTDQRPEAAFLMWILVAVLGVLASGWLIFFWVEGAAWREKLGWQMIQPFLPAMFSVVIAILIRYNQFSRLVASWSEPQTAEEDNSISL